jgi:hypothetical protein
LLAKLVWDPETEVQRHLIEFTDAYYGRAAGRIRACIDLTHSAVRFKDCHARIFDNPQSCYLEREVIVQADELLGEAEELAEDDTIRFRVKVARLPVWYVQLANRWVEGAERTARLREFLSIARQNGVTHISESKPLSVWAREMGAE